MIGATMMAAALTLKSAANYSITPPPPASVSTVTKPATPSQLTNAPQLASSASTAYVSTYTVTQPYQNLYGITVAKQSANTQWEWQGGTILSYLSLWQNFTTAPLYYDKNPGSKWNYKYSSVGQSNEWVTFYSGVPTPWGNVQVSSFTSRILSTVHGNGTDSYQVES